MKMLIAVKSPDDIEGRVTDFHGVQYSMPQNLKIRESFSLESFHYTV